MLSRVAIGWSLKGGMKMTCAPSRGFLSIVAAILLTSACSDISDEESKALSNSGAVVVNVTSEQIAFRFPELPARQTVGQGAAEGAAQATFETVLETIGNPFSIILLPIMLPAGAVIGAASVPDDEEWAEISTKYQRLKEAQIGIYSDRQRRNTAREIETGILSAFEERSDSCIATARNAAQCRNRQPVSMMSVRVQPVIDGDGYTLRTAVSVSLPGRPDVICIKKDYSRLYSRVVADGTVSAESALGTIAEMHAAFGGLLAFELYEAPVRISDADIGQAQRRASEGIGMPQEGDLPCVVVSAPER
jgi:hypothetical protein